MNPDGVGEREFVIEITSENAPEVPRDGFGQQSWQTGAYFGMTVFRF